jgi:hypothetical protein
MNEDWFHMARLRLAGLAQGFVAACCIAISPFAPAAEKGANPQNAAAENSGAQRKGAEEYLAALASGDPAAIAFTIHQSELEQLRKRLLDDMRTEADRNDSLIRTRLFGAGMPLTDIERLTPQNFFVTLAQRLRFSGREFESVDWLEAVKDSGGMVQMVGRLKPPKDRGTVRVPVLVSIVPWGKDWKAAMPLELQAQIDDLRSGRVRAPGPRPAASAASATADAGTATPAAAAVATAPAAVTSTNPKAIVELFDAAEKDLNAADCDNYYDKRMSPNFRKTTGTKALRTLVKTCETRQPLRDQMLTAIKLARAGSPRYEYAGTRAIYDLSGQGLPYPALVLEQIEKRWYIAE